MRRKRCCRSCAQTLHNNSVWAQQTSVVAAECNSAPIVGYRLSVAVARACRGHGHKQCATTASGVPYLRDNLWREIGVLIVSARPMRRESRNARNVDTCRMPSEANLVSASCFIESFQSGAASYERVHTSGAQRRAIQSIIARSIWSFSSRRH